MNDIATSVTSAVGLEAAKDARPQWGWRRPLLTGDHVEGRGSMEVKGSHRGERGQGGLSAWMLGSCRGRDNIGQGWHEDAVHLGHAPLSLVGE
jgi:hypothetical protein